MFRYDELDGVIFDVDETLLDTGLHDRDNGLHEQARLQALYEAGKRHDLPQLLKITPHENLLAFLEASVHTLEGAVWTALYRRKAVDTLEINYNDPLLQEIVLRKDELYEHLLRTQGKPVAGAVAFVQALAAKGVPLAIASTAIRRDIDIFLETSGLAPCFPPERIISKADVQHPKPHPEAFDMAFRTLGLPDTARTRVLAVEDNPRGVMSATAAGLFTCAITTAHTRHELVGQPIAPQLIVDSFAEFGQLLGLI
jgi:HAD superfamily hydrolase (TIGR01509 family)